MTASEMHYEVVVGYEKINSNSAPGISDSEMSIMLSKAQLHFVQSRINPILNTKREGLEETEVRMQGLSALISTANINTLFNGADNLPNGSFVTLPSDFMYSILETCDISAINCFTKNPATDVPVYVISHNDYIKLNANPYKKPYFNGYEGLVWRLVYSRQNTGYADQSMISFDANTGYYVLQGQTGKRHELITDSSFSITNYFLRYLKLPRGIVTLYNGDGSTTRQVNCELDESTQWAIIDITIDMLKDSVQQPNQKTIPPMQHIE